MNFEGRDSWDIYPEKKKTYATLVPKNVSPEVTAPVGKVSLLEEKPTCVKSPVVGTI